MLPGERLRAEVFPCCYRCLILNPREVEAPYWPLRWMTAGGRSCDHPASEVENVTPGMLSKARNMPRLLKQLERKHYRWIAGKSLSSRLLSVTSKVRGSDWHGLLNSTLVSQAGATMSEILGQVNLVSGLIAEISAAAV